MFWSILESASHCEPKEYRLIHPTLETTVAQWLRCCAENQKVAGLIPADIKSFRSHYGPGVDLVSNRNEYQEYFLGGKGGRCLRLTTYHHPVPLSQNLGTLNSWSPVMGLFYLYLLPLTYMRQLTVYQRISNSGTSRFLFNLLFIKLHAGHMCCNVGHPHILMSLVPY